MALSPGQVADAQKIYSIAVQRGVPAPRAKELALAAFHEGGLDPNAHNPSGAEGDFQLLSPGYQAKATALGGLHNTRANELAILPDYQRYWQQHPNAPVGEAAAAVERSGKGADYYGANGDLLSFLGSVGGDIAAGGPARHLAGAGPQPMEPASPLGGPSMDARRQFALTIAQNIGSHNHDPAAFATAVQQLHQAAGADTVPVEHAPSGYAAAGGDSSIVAKVAHNYLGVPYKWGGSTLKGMDCSAFVQNVYKQLGVKLPRTTYDQVNHGQAVGLHELAPGDAIFTEPGHAGPNHVGLYVGNGMVQESPHTGDVNKLIPLDDFLSGGFVAARRYLPNA